MNWIDFVIIALLAFGLIGGFINGLIIEIAELAALVLGVWGAIHFSWWTADKLSGWFDMHSSWTGIVSFAVTFIAIVIAIYLLGKLLDSLLKAVALGFFGKIFGLSIFSIRHMFDIGIACHASGEDTILVTVFHRSDAVGGHQDRTIKGLEFTVLSPPGIAVITDKMCVLFKSRVVVGRQHFTVGIDIHAGTISLFQQLFHIF